MKPFLKNSNLSKIAYGTTSLSYSNSIILRGHVYFSSSIQSAIVSIVTQYGTPTGQVNQLVVEPNYNGEARLEIYAQGSGFVSGHILKVSYIVILS